MAKVDVELWDTSGNLKYDNCWPALAREAHGVMFVFHPGIRFRNFNCFTKYYTKILYYF